MKNKIPRFKMEDSFLEELHRLLQKSKQFEKVSYAVVSSAELTSSNIASDLRVIPDAKFIDFLYKIGVNIQDGMNKLLNPAILFVRLATSSGLLRTFETFGPRSSDHKSLLVSKIYTDKFGIFCYDHELKPLGYTDFGFGSMSLTDCDLPHFIKLNKEKNLTFSIKRHPQLRRLLKKYCDLNDIYFNDQQLEIKLVELGVNNPIYNYYDADESIILESPGSTYFDLIPLDLKRIIIKCIDYKVEQIRFDNDLVSDVINKIISDGVDPSNSNSLGDIFNNLRNNGTLEKVHATAGGERNMNDFIVKMGGMANIINSAIAAVMGRLSENESQNDL